LLELADVDDDRRCVETCAEDEDDDAVLFASVICEGVDRVLPPKRPHELLIVSEFLPLFEAPPTSTVRFEIEGGGGGGGRGGTLPEVPKNLNENDDEADDAFEAVETVFASAAAEQFSPEMNEDIVTL